MVSLESYEPEESHKEPIGKCIKLITAFCSGGEELNVENRYLHYNSDEGFFIKLVPFKPAQGLVKLILDFPDGFIEDNFFGAESSPVEYVVMLNPEKYLKNT